MLWRPLGLVVALELLAAIGDAHRLGAGFSSERFLMTVLPVDSDLIRTIGSSWLPTRVTLPPLRVGMVARSPPMLVITPKVRAPWYIQLTRSPRFISFCLWAACGSCQLQKAQ